jgi:hypothetical protein
MYIDLKNDKIKCVISLDITNILNEEHFPLQFKVYSIVDNLLYECELNPGMWAEYYGSCRDKKVNIKNGYENNNRRS